MRFGSPPAGRHLLLLVAGAVLTPCLLFGYFAWHNHEDVYAAAQGRAVRTARLLHEHAVKILETQELVLELTQQRLQGASWDEIRGSKQLWDELADIDRRFEQVDSIFVLDAKGMNAVTTRRFPSPSIDFSDRDYFQAHAEKGTGVYLGKRYVGSISRQPIVNLSIRRETADGTFDGVIGLSAFVGYFEKFYASVGPASDNYIVAIVRDDGETLIRYPETTSAATLPAVSAFHTIVGSGRRTGIALSAIDGFTRLYAFERLRGFPAYVAYAIDERAVKAIWHRNLLAYGALAGLAMVMLLLLGTLALRRERAQSLAIAQLSQEVERRQRAEEAAEQSARLEAIGKVTGGVAHDFNNLLTVLGGQIEMLKARSIDDRGKKILDGATRTIERGEQLTRQLLGFARRRPLTFAVFDPNACLREMSDVLENALGAPRKLRLALAEETWPVETDRAEFELAILNLAVNARDAMAEGGSLTVQTRNVPAAEAPQGCSDDLVAVGVRDEGSGMAPDVLARAFEPFFTTKPAGKGTGLGLSSVYGFARQSGGTVTIESAPGAGTTVTLYLRKGSQLQSYQPSPSEHETGSVVRLRRG